MWKDSSKCNLAWKAKTKDDYLVHCTCIRKVGHEGNHVSYPSGEELEQTPTKKPKSKQLTS